MLKMWGKGVDSIHIFLHICAPVPSSLVKLVATTGYCRKINIMLTQQQLEQEGGEGEGRGAGEEHG